MAKNTIDALKAQIAKFDITSPEGKSKAAEVVRAARKKASAEAHAKRREAHEISDLLRSLEVDPNRQAKRIAQGRRGNAFAMIPTAKAKPKN